MWADGVANVNAEGEYWYNTSTDTIYVWAWGDGDPDAHDMEISSLPNIYFEGKDFITIWGFKIRYGRWANIFFNPNSGNPNSFVTISHCHITRQAFDGGTNPANIFSNSAPGYSTDTTDHNRHILVQACTLGYSMGNTQSNTTSHTGVYIHYGTSFSVVESCVVKGVMDNQPWRTGLGIDLKGGEFANVVRYNVVDTTGNYGLSLLAACRYDSLYGNIVRGTSSLPTYPIIIGYASGGNDSPFACNNTVYAGGSDMIYHQLQNAGTGIAKYNILYRLAGTADYWRLDWDNWVIDSNMYYPANCSSLYWAEGVVAMNFGAFNTAGYDQNGSCDVDPAFDSLGAVNPWLGFKRTGASQEMEVTYGGRTWYNYGAVQNDYGAGSSGKLTPIMKE